MDVCDALRTSRGVRTLFDQSGHDILMRVRPLNMCVPPPAPSRPLKNPARSAFLFDQSEHGYTEKHGHTKKTHCITTNIAQGGRGGTI